MHIDKCGNQLHIGAAKVSAIPVMIIQSHIFKKIHTKLLSKWLAEPRLHSISR